MYISIKITEMTSQDLSPNEHHPHYSQYIDLVPKEESLVQALHSGRDQTVDFFESLDETKINYRYAEGKWTPKEILMHLIDTERVFTYRALRFARKDTTPLQGFDQDDYIRPSKVYSRSLASLVAEFKSVRASTLSLFEFMDEDMLKSIGVASNSNLSARAAGFITAGHSRSHIQIIKDRYLS